MFPYRWARSLTLVTALLALLAPTAALADLPPGGSFVDDDGNIHEGYIEAIKEAGVTTGCNPPINDRYCPTALVTRGQMAAFLVRALGLAPASTDYFMDDNGSLFEGDINALAAAGVTRGCNPPANDRYCPNGDVTRDQMAAFLVRAFGYDDPGAGDWFTDDDGSIFEQDIDRLRNAGVTLGCNPPTNTRYCPSDPVRRDQMASFLGRALGLAPLIPPSTASNCVRPDSGTVPNRQIIVRPGESPTLGEAFADARPGDHIVLEAGVHRPGGNVAITQSGLPAAWIHIKAAPGTTPIIDLNGAGEFRIGASYVSLQGVDIRNGGGNNLHIAPGSEDVHHVHVADTVIHDLAWGPGAAIKINRNNPQGAGVGTICLENNDVSEAINNAIIDGVGVAGAVVIGNDIHDNAAGSHGIFFKGGSSDILIEGNLIRGIRANAALQLGGNTGAAFWDPAHPAWEGVNQTARNNLIADFDDSAVEIRGVDGAYVYNNTIVTQSAFAVFRLQNGNNSSGGSSGNDNVHISNNLVVGTGGDPQYARNDGGAATISFGPQLWAGAFHNSGSATPGIPPFPQPTDIVVGPGELDSVVVSPSVTGLGGISDAVGRYRPAPGSPALGNGESLPGVIIDFLGFTRSAIAPSLGAIESAS
ncbi:MAG: right-handed parallel beta-helix repeat-containing protein [Acidimicrobiia bacterium]|nr:right-handed parallel beta-helix repeat-containing protein [Acidimicrobiia bacterium]